MNHYVLRQCCKITTPIFFGYIAIGIPFGLMIVRAGYPWWMSLFMGVTMYSGAGQYIAAGLLGAGAALAEIAITEFFVNIRHIVYGLSLIRKTKGIGWWKQVVVYTLTDETYAILTGISVPKNVAPGPFLGTIGILDHLYWILGGVIGAVAYNVLEHYNLSQYLDGVDFALTSLFVIILFGQISASRDVLPPLVGAGVALIALVLSKCHLLASSNIIFLSIILGVACIVLARGKIKAVPLFFVLAVALVICGALIAMEVCGIGVRSVASASQHTPLPFALLASLVSGLIIYLERLFPFALFSRKDPPPVIRFIEKYIPSMVIAILVVYSFKDVSLVLFPWGIPNFAGVIAAVLLHIIFKNSMVSIFGSTTLFMILQRLM